MQSPNSLVDFHESGPEVVPACRETRTQKEKKGVRRKVNTTLRRGKKSEGPACLLERIRAWGEEYIVCIGIEIYVLVARVGILDQGRFGV